MIQECIFSGVENFVLNGFLRGSENGNAIVLCYFLLQRVKFTTLLSVVLCSVYLLQFDTHVYYVICSFVLSLSYYSLIHILLFMKST